MSTSITIRDLRKVFGQTVAVDRINLNIRDGDLFFLLGPSGCGKTTLLRMLAGFTDPTSGSIHFGDKEVTHLPPNKRNTGMVFQGYALWPHMTVEQNVAFGLGIRKVPAEQKKQRVLEALRSVRMEQYALRKPNELSGGQQQRVALARALVIEPTVLLLDEPLSNLDAKLRLEMRSEIKRICKQAKITGVYVTHDQKEALSMADGVAVLDRGAVVQIGPPRELYSRPVSRFVAGFLGETNFISAQIVSQQGEDVLLQCPAGQFRSSGAAHELPVKGNVTCSIRPEAIRILRDGAQANGLNVFDARIEDQIYLGEMAQHQLAAAQGLMFKVFELNPRPLPDGGSSPLRIAFDPRDVVILRD